MSKQSKPANPSDLLTHPAVVHAIKQNARRLSKIRLFRRVAREDIAADLRLEVAIRLQVFDPALSSIGTFASKAAHNGAISMLRTRAAESRRAEWTTVSIECVVSSQASADAVFSDALARASGRTQRDFTAAIEREDTVRALLRALPPRLAEVALALSDCSPNAACVRLGMSYRQCCHAVALLRAVCDEKKISA